MKCLPDPEGRHQLPSDWSGQLGAEGEDDLADPERPVPLRGALQHLPAGEEGGGGGGGRGQRADHSQLPEHLLYWSLHTGGHDGGHHERRGERSQCKKD